MFSFAFRYLRRRSDEDISLESYVYHLLYYVPLPPPSRSVKLTYFGETITCPRPKSSELPLFDYFMSDLFRLLDLDSFLQLFTCVLLENQVLLYSKGEPQQSKFNDLQNNSFFNGFLMFFFISSQICTG